MPYFIIEGHGKDSRRKRKPMQVSAKDRDSAIAKAKKLGIVADTVKLVEVSHFLIDVAGISHPNRDGTDRQSVVKRCRIGETLILEQEVGNPHDVHAITVSRENNEQLGYVPAVLADQVVEWHRTGCRYSAAAVQTIPLGENTRLLTVQVCIFVALSSASTDCVTKYVSEQLAKLNPQWQVERFLPRKQLGSHQWVPMREFDRDSFGRFTSTQPEKQKTAPATRLPASQAAKNQGKNGCLLSLVAVLAAVCWLGWNLSLAG